MIRNQNRDIPGGLGARRRGLPILGFVILAILVPGIGAPIFADCGSHARVPRWERDVASLLIPRGNGNVSGSALPADPGATFNDAANVVWGPGISRDSAGSHSDASTNTVGDLLPMEEPGPRCSGAFCPDTPAAPAVPLTAPANPGGELSCWLSSQCFANSLLAHPFQSDDWRCIARFLVKGLERPPRSV